MARNPHFLFPSDPLDRRRPDGLFADQLDALATAGFTTSLASDDGTRVLRPETIPSDSTVVYRGWMLSANGYSKLSASVRDSGAQLFIDQDEYLRTHHLPNWYPLVAEATPATRVFSENDDLVAELRALDWKRFFIKDFVKSLKTSVGSSIENPEDILLVLQKMKEYRDIEGGVCVRQYESFVPDTEVRYFVLNARVFAPDPSTSIPDVALLAAERVPSKFFSVDVAIREDGTLRIVELGDGQVSDLVGWSAERFAEVWKSFGCGGVGAP